MHPQEVSIWFVAYQVPQGYLCPGQSCRTTHLRFFKVRNPQALGKPACFILLVLGGRCFLGGKKVLLWSDM